MADTVPALRLAGKHAKAWRVKPLALVLLLLAANAHAEKIVIKGSNTFGEELGPRLAASYSKLHPDATFELTHEGTAPGIAALLEGQCDLAAASRPTTEDEERLARSRKIDLDFSVIGYYGASVIVNAANRVRNLTDLQVRDIFSGKINDWKDLSGESAPIHL